MCFDGMRNVDSIFLTHSLIFVKIIKFVFVRGWDLENYRD